jgi:hypothetical protein
MPSKWRACFGTENVKIRAKRSFSVSKTRKKSEKERQLFSWSDEQIAAIVKLQRRLKDDHLVPAIEGFFKNCERDDVPSIMAMTAVVGELLYLSAHMHSETATPESFVEMAKSAIGIARDPKTIPTEH